MNTSKQAMKQALQYIEANAETKDEHEIATGLRQAIREHAIYEMQRLGQEIEQEPVAYMYESVCGNDFATRCAAPSYAKNIRPLYTHPQQRKPLTDVLLHLFQEWKEDHLSQSNYIDAVEQIKAAHGIKGEA